MDLFQQTLTVNNFIEAFSAKDRREVVPVNLVWSNLMTECFILKYLFLIFKMTGLL